MLKTNFYIYKFYFISSSFPTGSFIDIIHIQCFVQDFLIECPVNQFFLSTASSNISISSIIISTKSPRLSACSGVIDCVHIISKIWIYKWFRRRIKSQFDANHKIKYTPSKILATCLNSSLVFGTHYELITCVWHSLFFVVAKNDQGYTSGTRDFLVETHQNVILQGSLLH